MVPARQAMKAGVALAPCLVETVPLLADGRYRCGGGRLRSAVLRAGLDGDPELGEQVPVPVGAPGPARVGE
ncbi:hypothetical protein SATRM34S_00788 [Streptomyces atroolivaceus]